jgi:hypothetical protein
MIHTFVLGCGKKGRPGGGDNQRTFKGPSKDLPIRKVLGYRVGMPKRSSAKILERLLIDNFVFLNKIVNQKWSCGIKKKSCRCS